MIKKSEIEFKMRLRDGYPGPIRFADFIVDGHSLYDRYAKHYDFVSCLGWGSEDFQQKHISRLILLSQPDFPMERIQYIYALHVLIWGVGQYIHLLK